MKLRLLVLTNLYPPHYLGGYELGCRAVVEQLRQRGHEITVLTSTYGVGRRCADGNVHRILSYHPESSPSSRTALLFREWQDQAQLRRLIAQRRPDLLYVFSLYGISQALPLTAQRAGLPAVYALSAEWLEPGFRGDPWTSLSTHPPRTGTRRVAKRILMGLLDPWLPASREQLDLRHAYFTSAALKHRYLSKGFAVESAPVIHWGVDTERFRPRPRPEVAMPPRLLFAGRIAREKGLHTVVEALRLLREGDNLPGVSLDIVGPVQDREYMRAVEHGIAQGELGSSVRFRGPIPSEAMPELYGQHDIYVFPSIWEEPFSIGLLEAMACGLAVVGTTTGGSREVLEDEVNCLTFPPGDAQSLARQLMRLLDPQLAQRLGVQARRTVERRFGLKRMMDRVETFLRQALARQPVWSADTQGESELDR